MLENKSDAELQEQLRLHVDKADKGDVNSMFVLAEGYFWGEFNIPTQVPDYLKTKEWLEKAGSLPFSVERNSFIRLSLERTDERVGA